tara:strand:- start:4277 stop:4420 length:144 start_codon:yes stop_codon:yes gene_type:complete
MDNLVYLMIMALGLFFAGIVSGSTWLSGVGFCFGVGAFVYGKYGGRK